MPFITFSSEKAKNQLLTHGIVYTIRKKRKKNGYYAVVTDIHQKRVIGVVYLEFVEVITKPQQMEKYVKESGFDSVTEWLEELRKFKCRLPAFLYKATLIKRERVF